MARRAGGQPFVLTHPSCVAARPCQPRFEARRSTSLSKPDLTETGRSRTANAGHLEAQRLYPNLEPCDVCGSARTERHHVDGNPCNNVRENIRFLCRLHHMEADGRLERLRKEAPRRYLVGRVSRFSSRDVERIRELRQKGLSQHQIARLLGTSQSHVGRLIRNDFGHLARPGKEPAWPSS